MEDPFKLSEASLSLISSGQYLEDIHIDYFNRLMIQFFPTFQPIQTWQFQHNLYETIPQTKRHLQILYSTPLPTSQIGHWICTYYDLNTLYLYDSLNSSKLHHDFERYLRKLHPYSFAKPDLIKQPTVQMQRNVFDRGVLAIANAVAVLFNRDPSQIVYDYNLMRSHIIQMFRSDIINLFPICPPLSHQSQTLSISSLPNNFLDTSNACLKNDSSNYNYDQRLTDALHDVSDEERYGVAERIITSCIYIRDQSKNVGRSLFNLLGKKIKAQLINYDSLDDKKSTLMDKIGVICGVSEHTPSAEPFFYEGAYNFHNRLPKIIQLDEDVLIDNPEFYILVRGIPTKKNFIWEDKVDVQRLFTAVSWYKTHNKFHSKIDLTDGLRKIAEHLKKLEIVHFAKDSPDESELPNGVESNIDKSQEFHSQTKIDEARSEEMIEISSKDSLHYEGQRAILTLKQTNDPYYDHYTIYPVQVRKQNDSDANVYQMLKINAQHLHYFRKDLDRLCFLNLYPYGNYGIYHKLHIVNPKFRYTAKNYLDRLKQGTENDNLSTIFARLRGTESFWKKPRNDLNCMMWNYGLATFFVTLSPDTLSEAKDYDIKLRYIEDASALMEETIEEEMAKIDESTLLAPGKSHVTNVDPPEATLPNEKKIFTLQQLIDLNYSGVWEDTRDRCSCNGQFMSKNVLTIVNKTLIIRLSRYPLANAEDNELNSIKLKGVHNCRILVDSKHFRVQSVICHTGKDFNKSTYFNIIKDGKKWIRVENHKVSPTRWPKLSEDVIMLFLEEI
ncbi:hypothetical protein QAD02_005726 [Eretmocerus hayati]|uniref:Uncharacterized protein n=1 Tax=Eretmocerus hayati TaxID=131215 RepID=A0ACC2NVZ6_9HYME|nr:hypothetical protein QAD02_005726 [Eretmocerus hayati]